MDCRAHQHPQHLAAPPSKCCCRKARPEEADAIASDGKPTKEDGHVEWRASRIVLCNIAHVSCTRCLPGVPSILQNWRWNFMCRRAPLLENDACQGFVVVSLLAPTEEVARTRDAQIFFKSCRRSMRSSPFLLQPIPTHGTSWDH